MTNINDTQTPLELIEKLTVTLLRAVNEYKKHKGTFFDSSYVTHNPKFYKLDLTNRALFVKILSETLKVDFYFGDSYQIKPSIDHKRLQHENEEESKALGNI